jgi:hypothetical protein
MVNLDMAYLLKGSAVELPSTTGGVIEERNTARGMSADFGSEYQIPAGKCITSGIFGVSVETQDDRGALRVVSGSGKE